MKERAKSSEVCVTDREKGEEVSEKQNYGLKEIQDRAHHYYVEVRTRTHTRAQHTYTRTHTHTHTI